MEGQGHRRREIVGGFYAESRCRNARGCCFIFLLTPMRGGWGCMGGAGEVFHFSIALEKDSIFLGGVLIFFSRDSSSSISILSWNKPPVSDVMRRQTQRRSIPERYPHAPYENKILQQRYQRELDAVDPGGQILVEMAKQIIVLLNVSIILLSDTPNGSPSRPAFSPMVSRCRRHCPRTSPRRPRWRYRHPCSHRRPGCASSGG
jgi:hypothetical protein